MFTVAVLGAGKIGEAICALFSASGRYTVKVFDTDEARAHLLAKSFPGVQGFKITLSDVAGCKAALQGCDAILSALPFHCNVRVAELALAVKAHYFDLTEDVATTEAVRKIASNAPVAFMPQCGLAPGFIGLAAAHLVGLFDKLDTVKLRVGALPIFPSNRLKYNLTWSTEGLINEYINLCNAIVNGKPQMVPALEGYEKLSLDGVEYEAFNTSGGLGSLAEVLEGKVRSLDYKTIRYPGHRELIAFLLHDLGFSSDRETLKRIFERSLPGTPQDKCVIFVEVSGWKAGGYVQRTYASTVYDGAIHGRHFGAIQITTAAGICAPVDLVLTGKLNTKGFVRCEEIRLPEFLNNEFGKYYRDDKALSGIGS